MAYGASNQHPRIDQRPSPYNSLEDSPNFGEHKVLLHDDKHLLQIGPNNRASRPRCRLRLEHRLRLSRQTKDISGHMGAGTLSTEPMFQSPSMEPSHGSLVFCTANHGCHLQLFTTPPHAMRNTTFSFARPIGRVGREIGSARMCLSKEVGKAGTRFRIRITPSALETDSHFAVV
ncbi:hypothetical protein N658DRAFT_236876 [Parathielavia hyrcaniae]|uniref:Uncharacterized protein n=1 Tax=Parathielavia hyrcaniae TaxID=113614 RepID=A0AAN6T4J1_9PEZI|nr:hypothetical protein N658DRAFT_236876 [Parathielavia hyrcaniae]